MVPLWGKHIEERAALVNPTKQDNVQPAIMSPNIILLLEFDLVLEIYAYSQVLVLYSC